MPVYKRKERGWFAVVSYTDDFGKHHEKSTKYFESKREASEAEIKLKLELKNNSSQKITFQRAYEEFCENQKDKVKTTTLITYPNIWRHFTYKDTEIVEMNVPKFQKWKDEMNQLNVTTKWKNKTYGLVKQVVEYANMVYGVSCPAIAICGNFKEPNEITDKSINFYTYEEFQQFIAQIDDLRYKALFTFLYYEGTRIGEANAIRWEDIDFEHSKIRINKTANTKIKGTPYLITSPKKKSSNRVIPMLGDTKSLLEQLNAFERQYKNYSDEWFVFGMERPMPESHLHDVKTQAANKAGIKNIRIHDFRHSAAVFYISQLHVPATTIQALLGHSTLATTLRVYHHLLPNQLDGLDEVVKNWQKSAQEFAQEKSKKV